MGFKDSVKNTAKGLKDISPILGTFGLAGAAGAGLAGASAAGMAGGGLMGAAAPLVIGGIHSALNNRQFKKQSKK
jgi:hypothetical protein